MKFLIYISDFIIPLIIFYVVGYGILNKKNIYDDFVHGAADGLKTVVGILPTLVGLMVAVGILSFGKSEKNTIYISRSVNYYIDRDYS